MKLVRKKVLKFIRENALLGSGDKVIVAFSGGADSMALVDILANLPDFPLELVLVHLNHSLRGKESDGDELFVRGIAEKYALALEMSRVDVALLAEERGLSLEEAGRDARRSFFLQMAEKKNADAIVLGHHRDDQAETVLMRLVRGAAGSGLTGMRPRMPGGLFVRPLLCMNRNEIESYLCKGALLWREDSSNSDVKFMRNRIRHELLPLLRTYNPAITDCLNQTAQALYADEVLLEEVVVQAWPEIVSVAQGEIRIHLEKLRHEPQALRKRLYRKALAELRGDLKRISAHHLADIDNLVIALKGSGKLSLPFGAVVIKKYDAIILTTVPEESSEEGLETAVNSCGSYALGFNKTLFVERVDSPPPALFDIDKNTVFVDLSRFPFPWMIRYFKNGDFFTPLGMSGRKKLKNLFIDKKISPESRKRIPLFFCSGEIFWVGGVQSAENARMTGAAGELLRLRMICEAPSNRH